MKYCKNNKNFVILIKSLFDTIGLNILLNPLLFLNVWIVKTSNNIHAGVLIDNQSMDNIIKCMKYYLEKSVN